MQGELDELEREEFFRLKKVQAKKKRDASIQDALVTHCHLVLHFTFSLLRMLHNALDVGGFPLCNLLLGIVLGKQENLASVNSCYQKSFSKSRNLDLAASALHAWSAGTGALLLSGRLTLELLSCSGRRRVPPQ